MAYIIRDDCLGCGDCEHQCPTSAIQLEEEQYRIDPNLCNSCKGHHDEPQCVVVCPHSYPVPLQAKKGRYKAEARIPTSPDLFVNGKNHPFATAIAIWEGCNVLAQRQTLPWDMDETGKLYYQRSVNRGKGSIALWIGDRLDSELPHPLTGSAAIAALEAIDIRAACLHLIYAAQATGLDKPWEQEFVIDDRQIEKYLGLDKRKDLSKTAKLTLIKQLAQQPCAIGISIRWPRQGKIAGFSIEESRLWHLQRLDHHFQEDANGCKHLIGLTFTIRPGIWAKYFLNQQGCKERKAFYQYGTLSQSLLSAIPSIWQQHEGAAKMMLWLLFKTRLGEQQRITVPTLMRVAYGEERVTKATIDRDDRKRLLRTFESDLEVLNHYGLKPNFDPATYLPEIQPLWVRLGDIPEDAEAALEFWINDGNSDSSLTDNAPRGKWNLLMQAKFLGFDLPIEWQSAKRKKVQNAKLSTGRIKNKKSKNQPQISGEEITAARKNLGISQRELARLTGKSQSWIRDVENGRFQAKLEDRIQLQKALGMQRAQKLHSPVKQRQ